MNKILLIIKREYTSRVRNRAFILSTLLTPLAFAALFGGSTFLAIRSETGEQHKVAVIDNTGIFKKNMKSTKEIKFEFPADVDTSNFIAKGYSDILLLTDNKLAKGNYLIRSDRNLSDRASNTIEKAINTAIEDEALQQNGIRKSQLDSIHKESQTAELRTEKVKGNTVVESNSGLAKGIGFACGFLIYFTMIIYGMMVMRGVMEEKVNRIAEVIVSSVKPFQLMMGKIIGIGAVGITQFVLWIILIFGLVTAAQALIPHDVIEQARTLQQNGGMMPGAGGSVMQASEGAQRLYEFKRSIGTINLPMVLGCFVFYFIGGYLFYAALFAAIGSVMEDSQNAQSLTLPVMMPIVFSFLLVTPVVANPASPLAVWTSMIPFCSPIVMLARVAFGVPDTVPYWQLAASMVSLILGFLFTTWLAGKIYRTGLLMYGKKISWKEMLKWVFRG